MIDRPGVWRPLVLLLGIAILSAAVAASRVLTARVAIEQTAGAGTAWGYGGGPRQIRYSALTQINRSNVSRLEVAWTYDTGEPGATPDPAGRWLAAVVYGYTPSHQAVCARRRDRCTPLDVRSGHSRQRPQPRRDRSGRRAEGTRVFAAVTNYIYAIDARDGQTASRRSARDGRIDLREHLGRDPETQGVRLTTPGVVYRDLMIVGGRVGEGLPTSPGDIRAYDVRTGALRWSFHTIPHPGEFGYETWPQGRLDLIGRRQQLGGHGARRGARHRLRADRIGRRRFLWRQSSRATICLRTR